MPSAKELRVAPIAARDAFEFIKRNHYSGTHCRNSQLHLGVFLGGYLEGVMQFGPSMDKRHVIGLVRDTKWNEFLELNRMAFTERLPRNSESRALGVALRLIRKQYPHVQWILSYADGAQCGDGTIYRASGFILTGIKPNKTLWQLPSGKVVANITFNIGANICKPGANGRSPLRSMGGGYLPGFQLRYIYFLQPEARARLTVPALPFSAIAEKGAAMYRGKRGKEQALGDHPKLGGANPTPRAPYLRPSKWAHADASHWLKK